MRHPHALDAATAALVIVDMQEAFRPAMAEFDAVAARIAKLVKGAALLGVPIVVTEHYPKGLGHIVEAVRAALPADEHPIVSKTAFSCCGEPTFVDAVNATGRKQLLVCGIEAHVCVCQTALDLLARDFQVHVVVDCITSRTVESREAGLARMRDAGAIVSTMEMALFELLRDARHPQFKAVHQLLK
jgi:nicotinamidase-related amidase